MQSKKEVSGQNVLKVAPKLFAYLWYRWQRAVCLLFLNDSLRLMYVWFFFWFVLFCMVVFFWTVLWKHLPWWLVPECWSETMHANHFVLNQLMTYVAWMRPLIAIHHRPKWIVRVARCLCVPWLMNMNWME